MHWREEISANYIVVTDFENKNVHFPIFIYFVLKLCFNLWNLTESLKGVGLPKRRRGPRKKHLKGRPNQRGGPPNLKWVVVTLNETMIRGPCNFLLEPIKISYHLAKFGGARQSGSRDKLFVCHVTLTWWRH